MLLFALMEQTLHYQCRYLLAFSNRTCAQAMISRQEANLTHISLCHDYEKFSRMPSWRPFDSAKEHKVVLENSKKDSIYSNASAINFFKPNKKKIGGSLKLKL